MNGTAAIGRTEPGGRVGDLVEGDAEFAATAVAARTFDRLPRPSSGVSRHGLTGRRRHAPAIPDSPRSSITVARTSARSDAPNVTVRPETGDARHHTRIVCVTDEDR